MQMNNQFTFEQYIKTAEHFVKARGLCKNAQGTMVGSSGRAVKLETLWQDYNSVQAAAGTGISVAMEFFEESIQTLLPLRSATAEPDPDRILKYKSSETIDQFLFDAMGHSGFTMGPSGESILRYGIDTPYDVLESIIKEYAREHEEESKTPGTNDHFRKIFSPARVGDALKKFISDKDVSARGLLRTLIRTYPQCTQTQAAYHMISHVLGIWEIKEDITLSTVVIMQWMWQTKRYCLDMPVLEPLMVNICGQQQGTMKTSFIKALTSPYKQYRVADAKLKSILDEREYTLYAKKYVIIFDELAKGRMDKHEMGGLITAVKAILTAETVGGRVMRTTQHIEMKRIFSAISSSNTSITNVIRDRTGMRRFYEVTVQSQHRTDTRLIHILNSLIDETTRYAELVWRSIDETLPNGYLGLSNYREQLYAVQDTYKIVDSVDLWLESGDIRDMPVQSKAIPVDGLTHHFAAFDLCETKTAIEKLNSKSDPFKWVVDYKLLKEAISWTEEEIGRNSSQFISRDSLLQHLNTGGYVVRQKGSEMYVLCTSVMGILSEMPGGI